MSFYSDYEKKKNKNKTSALLKVPQVVPQKPAKQDNSRRATAAHNREQQRVQAHQNAQRPASTYLTGGSKSAAEHCFSAAREHTAGLSQHRQSEHAAEQFTAACKHLSDRRQRDKKSAVCGKSAESAVFGKEGGRAAAQSAAERIYSH